MKKLSNLEMSMIKGGVIKSKPMTREFLGSFELPDGRAEYFYRLPDGTVYSVIR